MGQNHFPYIETISFTVDKTPTVTIMIVAHNEEKVILNKLKNVVSLDYPHDKLDIIVTSDNSTDSTNQIVRDFSHDNKSLVRVNLFEVKERKGKTNAQNEAQKIVDTEIIVMTDANSILKSNAINELVSYFNEDDVSYVCGKLEYSNLDASDTAKSESSYWNLDLKMRLIESDIQTITAGNGALYAVRNDRYIDIPLIESHDSSFPLYYALRNERALFNPEAIAYEKAGEVIEDELKRKIRMNRIILRGIMPTLHILNFVKYQWFTFFYLGHRTSRYLLWICHLMLFFSSLILSGTHMFYLAFLYGQLIFLIITLISILTKSENSVINMFPYYVVTIYAQWIGVINSLTGKNRDFWEKAESTR